MNRGRASEVSSQRCALNRRVVPKAVGGGGVVKGSSNVFFGLC